ncbi:MAG: diguanylate cyclase [Subtercola sp.]|nr:diguanylate cyclase [Subtercola sp.]
MLPLELDFRTRVIQVLAVETAVRYGIFAAFVDIEPLWVRVGLAAMAVVAAVVATLVRRRDIRSHVPGRILIGAAMLTITTLSLSVTQADLAVITSFSLLALTLSAITLDTYRAGAVLGVLGTALAVMVAVTRSSTPLAAALIYVGLVVTGGYLLVKLRHFLELARDEALSQAGTDSLTGLLNRRGMESGVPALDAEALALGKILGCLVLDLDHFKNINDTYGHQAGDLVLISTAWTLSREVRSPSLVVRTGGEEFAVFTPVADESELDQLAQRLTTRLRSAPTEEVSGEVLPSVTVSIGGAAGRAGTAAELAALCGEADRLLYEAKRAGRNTIRIGAQGNLR